MHTSACGCICHGNGMHTSPAHQSMDTLHGFSSRLDGTVTEPSRFRHGSVRRALYTNFRARTFAHAAPFRSRKTAGRAPGLVRRKCAAAGERLRTAETSESVGWQNIGRMLLVFGCIGSDFCKKICVLQHFSKSTRFSS